MSDEKDWSPRALEICEACSLVWAILIFGATFYVVFILDHSGWWFLAALIFAGSWKCKQLRSPAQLAANPDNED